MQSQKQLIRFPEMTLGTYETDSPIRTTSWTEDWLNVDFNNATLKLRYERNSGVYITIGGIATEGIVPFFKMRPCVLDRKILMAGKGYKEPRFLSYTSLVYTGFGDNQPGIRHLSKGEKLSEIVIFQDISRGFDEVHFTFQGKTFGFGYELGKLIAIELDRIDEKGGKTKVAEHSVIYPQGNHQKRGSLSLSGYIRH